MAFDWNMFRVAADLSHFVSKCILIWSIHSNKSAEGVSLITQIWYLLVFCARYLPMPLYIDYVSDPSGFHTIWNFSLKLFYLISSGYTIILMMAVYARTREREKAWKFGIGALVGSLVLAPFVMMIGWRKTTWSFQQFSWSFSIILESVCVLPQLLLLRQTTVPTVIDSFYLVTLGSYRAFYVLNWIVRGARHQSNEPISIIFGVIQTALYIDFAWVYFTRQRVKLRGGAVVDSDDLSKGWLVKRLLGNKNIDEDVDEEAGDGFNHHGQDGSTDARPKPRKPNWGPRGVSVSADDGVHDLERDEDDELDDPVAFEDLRDEDEGSKAKGVNGATTVVGHGSEWHDERSPSDVAHQVTLHALKSGYRHVDRAHVYRNEGPCAQALLDSGIARSDLFFTTKVPSHSISHEGAIKSVKESLAKCSGLGYIDLVLLHAPYGGKARLGAWDALATFVRSGHVRSIGVSNYGVHHLNELAAHIAAREADTLGSGGILSVNQVELHTWIARPDIVALCRTHGVMCQAYSPLARGTRWGEERLSEVAQRAGRTEGQALIRWSLQMGFVPLPKSVTQSRIKENAEVYDFELSAEDMETLDTRDYAPSTWDPTTSTD